MSLANRTLAGAVVDSSALMCILLDEPAAPTSDAKVGKESDFLVNRYAIQPR